MWDKIQKKFWKETKTWVKYLKTKTVLLLFFFEMATFLKCKIFVWEDQIIVENYTYIIGL